MKIVKKSLKILTWTLSGILGFVVLYLLFAFILSEIAVNTEVSEGTKDVVIYIKSNGVHTDIIVPIKNEIRDWTREIKFEQTLAKDSIAKFIAFGWGDRGFYLNTPQWSDLKVSTAFNAAFYRGTSIMHTQFYTSLSENERCRKILISKADYQSLVAYITKSFQTDTASHFIWIPNNSYGNDDAFYEGTGKYSLFKTCNTWANNALKSAHQKAALWTPSDKGIFCHYNP